jgi:hypothetical protein
MLLSIFLAKLIGIYMLVMAALLVLRKEQLMSSIKEWTSSKAMFSFMGVLNLFIGIAIAIGHPVWQLNFRGLITVMGYLAIVQGIMRLGFPDEMKKTVAKMLDNPWVPLAIMVILGVFLTYSGFTAS